MIRKIDDQTVEVSGTLQISIGRWKKGVARPRGYKTCAISDRAIVKGDLVYRPLEYFNGPPGQRVLAEEMERRIDK